MWIHDNLDDWITGHYGEDAFEHEKREPFWDFEQPGFRVTDAELGIGEEEDEDEWQFQY